MRARQFRYLNAVKSLGRTGLFLFLLSIFAQLVYAEGDASPVEVLSNGRSLIAANQAGQAYQYLLGYETLYAGIPEFDYLLGVAAVDSGNASYAVVALQRSVAVNPKFVGARLDLGRSYFLLKQFDDARSEFRDVLNYDPPSNTRKLIDKYLDLIGKQESKGEFDLKFNVTGSAGSDTNANSGISSGNQYYPGVSDPSRQTASLFYSAGGGGALRYITKSQWIMSGEAQVSKRTNFNASFVDYLQLDTSLNLQRAVGKQFSKWDLTASRADIGDSLTNYNVFGSYFFRQKTIGENSIHSLVRAGTTRYTGADKSRDMYQLMIGGGYVADLGAKMPLTTNTTFIVGRSQPVEESSKNANFMTGIRLHGDYAMFSRLRTFASGGVLVSLYDQKFDDFTGKRTRYDGKFDLSAGMLLLPFRGWSIQPQAVYTLNASSIDVFDFQRLEYFISMRAELL